MCMYILVLSSLIFQLALVNQQLGCLKWQLSVHWWCWVQLAGNNWPNSGQEEDEQRRDITDEARHALAELLGFLQWDWTVVKVSMDMPASGRETRSGHCTLEGSLLSSLPVPGAVLAVQGTAPHPADSAEKAQSTAFPCLPQSLPDQGHHLVVVVGLDLFWLQPAVASVTWRLTDHFLLNSEFPN